MLFAVLQFCVSAFIGCVGLI